MSEAWRLAAVARRPLGLTAGRPPPARCSLSRQRTPVARSETVAVPADWSANGPPPAAPAGDASRPPTAAIAAARRRKDIGETPLFAGPHAPAFVLVLDGDPCWPRTALP